MPNAIPTGYSPHVRRIKPSEFDVEPNSLGSIVASETESEGYPDSDEYIEVPDDNTTSSPQTTSFSILSSKKFYSNEEKQQNFQDLLGNAEEKGENEKLFDKISFFDSDIDEGKHTTYLEHKVDQMRHIGLEKFGEKLKSMEHHELETPFELLEPSDIPERGDYRLVDNIADSDGLFTKMDFDDSDIDECDLTGVLLDSEQNSIEALESNQLISSSRFRKEFGERKLSTHLEDPTLVTPEIPLFNVEDYIYYNDPKPVSIAQPYPVRLTENEPSDFDLFEHVVIQNGVIPDETLLTGFIVGFGIGGDLPAVNRVVKYFQENNMKPTERLLNVLCEAYSRSLKLVDVRRFLDIIKDYNFDIHPTTKLSLIYCFTRTKFFDEAEEVYDSLRSSPEFKPSAEYYALVLSTFSHKGNVDKVNELLNEFPSNGLSVTINMLNNVLEGFLYAKDYSSVFHFFKQIKNYELTPTQLSYDYYIEANQLANNAAGVLHAIKQSVHDMVETKIEFFEHLVKVYCATDKLEQIDDVITFLKQGSLPFSSKFFQPLVEYYLNSGATDKLRQVLRTGFAAHSALVEHFISQNASTTLLTGLFTNYSIPPNKIFAEIMVKHYFTKNAPVDLTLTLNYFITNELILTPSTWSHAAYTLFSNKCFKQVSQICSNIKATNGDFNTIIEGVKLFENVNPSVVTHLEKYLDEESIGISATHCSLIDIPFREKIDHYSILTDAVKMYAPLLYLKSKIPAALRAKFRDATQKKRDAQIPEVFKDMDFGDDMGESGSDFAETPKPRLNVGSSLKFGKQ